MEKISIKDLAFDEFFKGQVSSFSNKNLIPARIVQVERDRYKIISEFGESNAILKKSKFFVEGVLLESFAVGDFVLILKNPSGDDVIYELLERKSKFSRQDTFNGIEQIVAANFDYVFIVVSLNQDFNIKRIERYLTASWDSGGSPVIVLTKADLCDKVDEYVEELKDIVFGLPIIPVSSYTLEGIDNLKKYMEAGKTIVLLGSSGVGKSSLVNAITGENIMKVKDIREDDAKGRHTTTHRELIILENKSMVIDTPGMRELGMWSNSEGLDSTFPDIEELACQCKFRDCKHTSEPGCAVLKAIEDGRLSKDKLKSYQKLRKEIEYSIRKDKINETLKRKAEKKALSKQIKKLK